MRWDRSNWYSCPPPNSCTHSLNSNSAVSFITLYQRKLWRPISLPIKLVKRNLYELNYEAQRIESLRIFKFDHPGTQIRILLKVGVGGGGGCGSILCRYSMTFKLSSPLIASHALCTVLIWSHYQCHCCRPSFCIFSYHLTSSTSSTSSA